MSELRTRLEFDIDSNGEVSEDEAKVCTLLTTFACAVLNDLCFLSFHNVNASITDSVNNAVVMTGYCKCKFSLFIDAQHFQ